MGQPQTNTTPKLIHVGTLQLQNHGITYLFLRQLEPYRFVWFQENPTGAETETDSWGGSAEEAILDARKLWKANHFRLLECGFRYTLPERDEIGMNALFHQMASSYSSMNGIYFDEDLGSNCIVQNASLEARDLWKRLSKI